jgi:hypothetical protein
LKQEFSWLKAGSWIVQAISVFVTGCAVDDPGKAERIIEPKKQNTL